MSICELKLTASENSWRLFMLRRSDKRFEKLRDKLLLRDRHTCQFCGFRTRQLQEIVNVDGDYTNNKSSNMVTACLYCSQCLFLESVGQNDFGGGNLIYLPEMSQQQLNACCHVMFGAFAMGASYDSEVSSTYRAFKLRTKEVEKELGDGMSKPDLLGQLMIDSGVDDLVHIQSLLDTKIRLLPNMAKYELPIRKFSIEALQYTSGGVV